MSSIVAGCAARSRGAEHKGSAVDECRGPWSGARGVRGDAGRLTSPPPAHSSPPPAGRRPRASTLRGSLDSDTLDRVRSNGLTEQFEEVDRVQGEPAVPRRPGRQPAASGRRARRRAAAPRSRSPPPSCARSRTPPSPRPWARSKASACAASPTASSGEPGSTSTSCSSSTASPSRAASPPARTRRRRCI